jgi:molybdopterin-containing oxidoreductase family iron-sulfur binding subunit
MSQTGTDPRTRYFRSLDELQRTPEFEQFLEREFPKAASEFPEGVSRRRWLQLMGASLALGGLSGCRYNREEVAAFVMRPEGRIPGVPEHFATNFEWAGRVVNALVANLDGRPIKVDGNAEHPAYSQSQSQEFVENKKLASAGTDRFTQASILSLYDQDRIGTVLNRRSALAKPEIADSDDDDARARSWSAFRSYAANRAQSLGDGKGLAILYEPTASPSVRRLLAATLAKYPAASLVRYEAVYSQNVNKAIDAVGATGSNMLFDLDAAKVIVALDSDLLGSDPQSVHYARQFANHRAPSGPWMNRLYVAESQYSITGVSADFRLPIQSSQIGVLLRAIENAIDAGDATDNDQEETPPIDKLRDSERIARVVSAIASDLLKHKGEGVLCVGAHQPLSVQVAAIRINQKLGNIGKTVKLVQVPNELAGSSSMKLDDFFRRASEFSTAWVLMPNPVFTVAGDVDLGGAFKTIGEVVYFSQYDDETAKYCRWTVPAAHPLEAWGDVRNADGTYGVCQPLIDPLLGGISPVEFLATLAGMEVTSSQEIVKQTAKAIAGGQLSDRLWKETLHSGYMPGTSSPLFAGTITADAKELKANEVKVTSRVYDLDEGLIRTEYNEGNVEVLVLPSETIYDGRLGNNGWLQECPQSVTKLTWDNAAICSPKTASALNLQQGEIAAISLGEAKAKLPVFVVPGHAEGSITVHFGYGRTKESGGSVAGAVGTNVASFRRWNQAAIYTGVSVDATTEPYRLATTQDHFALDDLGMAETAKRAPQLVREGTLFEYKEDPKFTEKIVELHFENESLWKEPKVDQNHKWGMAIDLNKCTGCNACVIACQAENNVPIVGKEQVIRGREMHWLRIDRYYQADVNPKTSRDSIHNPTDTKVVMQPMACAHCETAPCEQVCPVAATVHTEEGINAMAYNRCIGTRYCANNCPYKVRRFNYLNYNDEYGYYYGWQDYREKASKKLQSLVLNPEVSVRGRGVMEKCTYCIQRVQNGKIASRTKGDGKVHDGDIRSACQEACPSHAIVFGDLLDASSRVSQMHRDPRAYAVLEELNIKPRTKYLSRIRNIPKRLATTSQLRPERFAPHHSHDDHGHGSGNHGDHS